MYSQVVYSFVTPEPHPDTIELARKLIDEIQTAQKSTSHASKLPPVPAFKESANQRKPTVEEMFGSSDSESVSDFDYRNVGGGDSDSFGEEAPEAEDMYSGEESSKSESGESSSSNYESTSSFESRRKKHFRHSSHGSATSKAAAAGRKEKMKANKAAAIRKSPQAVYSKNKRKAAVRTPDGSQESSSGNTISDNSGSGNGGSESSDGSPPPVMRKGKGKAPPKQKASLPRQRKAAKKDTPPPTDFNENPHRRPKGGKGLPVRRVEAEYEGSQREGIPIVDSRPGKKRTRAGRKRRDTRRGRIARKGLQEASRRDEPELVNAPEAAVLPTRQQLGGQMAVENVVEEDPMLEEEILRPLIINELADDGHVFVPEMVDGMKIWDVEVHCNGGYHWYCGDINWHTFPDPPAVHTFVPAGPPGPNIPNLQHMHPILVLERFLPIDFWTKFTQETNAYKDRQTADPQKADPDELDVMLGLADKPHTKAAWKNDYDLNWIPLSVGTTLKWFGLHVGMAIRPRHNTAAYWDQDVYGCLTPDAYSSYMSRNRFNLITKYMYLNYAAAEHFDANGKLIDPYHKVRPLIDVCKKLWLENWNIGEFNCVDEGKVAYSGTMCPVRMYDPDKPIKHGIKFYCANDSLTGYCWGLEPYCGSGHRIVEDTDWDYDNLNFPERIVLYFMSKCPQYTSFFTDRYYTTCRGIELGYERHRCYWTGTMMANKKGMPWKFLCDFNQLDSDRGFYTWSWEKEKNIWAINWKDRNVVPLASNRYGCDFEFIERGGGGKYKTSKLKATNVPYGRYRFTTGKMVVPYNRYMFYSLEATSHCHKWWQNCFWGIIDGALVNAFICWRSVDPSRRTHMRFMTGVHQALVNNQWDTIGHWGARSLQSPDVTRRQKKFKGKYVNKTPPTPVTIIPTVKSPTGVTHELVLLNKTALHQNMIRRKEVKPNAKAEKRCVQCKKDGRQNVFTKWVCLGCGYIPLCNPKWKRKVHHILQKYHASKKISLMQGQRELAKKLEEVD